MENTACVCLSTNTLNSNREILTAKSAARRRCSKANKATKLTITNLPKKLKESKTSGKKRNPTKRFSKSSTTVVPLSTTCKLPSKSVMLKSP